MKLIKVKVGPQGKIQVEAEGFTGGECLEATRAIEEALGLVKERELKGEFYLAQTEAQAHLLQGGGE